jgi:hypothetical protein
MFSFAVGTLSDGLLLSLIDSAGKGKEKEKGCAVGTIRLEVADMLPPHEFNDSWQAIAPGVDVHIKTHVAGPGLPAWERHPFTLPTLWVSVWGLDLPSEKSYVRIGIAGECGRQTGFGSCVSGLFCFVVAAPATACLDVRLCAHDELGADAELAGLVPVSQVAGGGDVSVRFDNGATVSLRGAMGDRGPGPVQLPVQPPAGPGGFWCHCALFCAVPQPGVYVKARFRSGGPSRCSSAAEPRIDWTFSLPVAAIAGECLEIALLVHHWDRADDLLGSGSVLLEDIGFGQVYERAVAIADVAELGLRAHFALAGGPPFVERPFALPRVRVIIGEASGFAQTELTVGYGIAVDAVMHGGCGTESRPPQWFAEHDMWVLDKGAELTVRLWTKAGKKSETVEGEVKIQLAEVPKEDPLIGWWPVPGIGRGGVKVNIAVQWIIDGRRSIDVEGLAVQPIPAEFASSGK